MSIRLPATLIAAVAFGAIVAAGNAPASAQNAALVPCKVQGPSRTIPVSAQPTPPGGIQDVPPPSLGSPDVTPPSPNATPPPGASATPPPSGRSTVAPVCNNALPAAGSLEARIFQAMLAFLGTNTKDMFGAAGDWGKEACALSVSAILRNAGINVDDAYAPTLFQDLQKMGARLVPVSQAKPGDIVFENGLGHVGIYCGNTPPCTGDVESNSSSAGAFVWGSDRGSIQKRFCI